MRHLGSKENLSNSVCVAICVASLFERGLPGPCVVTRRRLICAALLGGRPHINKSPASWFSIFLPSTPQPPQPPQSPSLLRRYLNPARRRWCPSAAFLVVVRSASGVARGAFLPRARGAFLPVSRGAFLPRSVFSFVFSAGHVGEQSPFLLVSVTMSEKVLAQYPFFGDVGFHGLSVNIVVLCFSRRRSANGRRTVFNHARAASRPSTSMYSITPVSPLASTGVAHVLWTALVA
jgi:hypothetical protein